MTVQVADPTQKRLRILGDEEITALYTRPHFTDEERLEYFSLAPTEHAMLEQFHSIASRLYCLLQLGYFKARHMFFAFELPEVIDDARYLQQRDFPDLDLTDCTITHVTRLRQQRVILALYNYRSCHAQERQQLERKALQSARVDSKPISIFRELMQYLTTQRIVAPAYSVMQDTVGKALTEEQDRLAMLLRTHLAPGEIDTLKRLLEDTQGLYEITLLKREPRDFSRHEIAREIERGQQIRALYALATRLLPSLAISNESIKYYASLVTYYSVFRLKQLKAWIVHLYLLCFVYHRYQKLHDNLLNSLMYHVRHYDEAAKEAAKDRVYAHRMEGNEHLLKAGQLLTFFTDDTIAESTPFLEVRTKAFAILDRHQIAAVAEHLTTNARFDDTVFHWEHIDGLGPQFKRQLRPILLTVDLVASPGHRPLTDAVHFLQGAFSKGRPLSQYPPEAFPLRVIPDTVKPYLYGEDGHGQRRLLPDRYEFLVYRLLRQGLESGDIFCRDSVRFRSFEDDLVDTPRWQAKDTLIVDTGLPILQQPIREHLAELEQRLETRLSEVNQRLAAGENPHFEVKRRGPTVRWTLHYPHDTEPVNQVFFEALTQVDIGSVLHFVHQHCHFLDAFDHVLGCGLSYIVADSRQIIWREFLRSHCQHSTKA